MPGEILVESAIAGQYMKYNGSDFVPDTPVGVGGGPHASSHATGGLDVVTPASIGACAGNDSRLSDARTPLTHSHPWGQVTGTPTTVAGYGITDAAAAVPLRQYSLASEFPFAGTPLTLTPTAHAANVARVFPFQLSGPMTLNRVLIRTNAVLSNCLQVGIFNASGTRLFNSGVLSTVATGWVSVSVSALALPAGDYYFASTNNNVVNATAAYTITPVHGTGALLPRWGTVPATNGAMPASIDPTAITETVGGWMAYTLLSEFTT